jgi:hypothetical protein
MYMMYNGENIPIYRTTHTSHDTPLVEFSLKATVEPPIDFKSAVLRLTICPQVCIKGADTCGERSRGYIASRRRHLCSPRSTTHRLRPSVGFLQGASQSNYNVSCCVTDARFAESRYRFTAAEIGLGSLLASPAPREFAVRGARGSHGRALPTL